jgi:hypothetical protein
MAKYYIRYEQMGGEWYYMIYQKRWCGDYFSERCNKSETAVKRLEELNGHRFTLLPPDDWRERLADGDPKALKHLKGFRSPAHFYEGFKSLRREYTKVGQKLNSILKQHPELK